MTRHNAMMVPKICVEVEPECQILRENSKSFFVNCFGQAMNLAVSDICFLKDVLETIYEISNLIKIYPKRNQMLNRIRLFPIQDFAFFARQGRP